MPNEKQASQTFPLSERLATRFPDVQQFRDYPQWYEGIGKQLDPYFKYLKKMFSTIPLPDEGEKDEQKQQFLERIKLNALEIMGRNHLMSLVINTDRYKETIKREKSLRGDKITVGKARCIDGRLANNDEMLYKVHEAKAGLLEIDHVVKFAGSHKDHRESEIVPVLKSGKMIEAIKKPARKGKPLVQILLAHTDDAEKPCDCGAMNAAKDNYKQEADLTFENLEEQIKRGGIIDRIYSEEAKLHNKPPQEKTAVTAVYETGTRGILLGYKTDNQFSTTSIARQMAQPENTTGYIGAISLKPGQLSGSEMNLEAIIENEEAVLSVTEALLKNSSLFYKEVNEYIASDLNNLALLNPEQKQAFCFYLARTTAIQYLTGSYSPESTHPYKKHAEKFMSIAPDQNMFGQMLPEQVFCASPHESSLTDHIVTQFHLMDHYQTTEKPILLFMSAAHALGLDDSHTTDEKGRLVEYIRQVFTDVEISACIEAGTLIPIPLIINEKTRDVNYVFDTVGVY